MLGIEPIDWAIILLYLVGITLVGLWATRKVHSSASFFMGDRKFGKVMMAFFMFGAGTHSEQAVGVAAMVLGAGRATVADKIDPAVGVSLHRKVGDPIQKGERLATVLYNDASRLDAATARLKTAYVIGPEAMIKKPIISKVID